MQQEVTTDIFTNTLINHFNKAICIMLTLCITTFSVLNTEIFTSANQSANVSV